MGDLTTQVKKYNLGMSGEFSVAAQLQRQGINASVTYGNSKKADVIAFSANSNKYTAIEVKSTSNSKWVVGSRVPEKSGQIWVFVYIPLDIIENPEFYILSQTEIHNILKPIEDEYFKRYKEKHGIDYDKKKRGVASLKRSLIEDFKNEWSKITECINS